MAFVYNVILIVSSIDDENVSLFNKRIIESDEIVHDFGLDRLESLSRPICSIYTACYNYMCDKEFIEILKSIKWICPENVQLLIKHEHNDKFMEINNA